MKKKERKGKQWAKGEFKLEKKKNSQSPQSRKDKKGILSSELKRGVAESSRSSDPVIEGNHARVLGIFIPQALKVGDLDKSVVEDEKGNFAS